MTLAESIRSNAVRLMDGAEYDEALTMICPPIAAYLTKQLRPDTDTEECRSCVALAGGILAASAIKSFASRGITSFDAGTLSLTLEDRSSEYHRLAMALIAPWRADGTAFRSVRS